MSDNVLQTLLQDVVVPDVRELKVRFESLEKRMETRFSAADPRIDSLERQINSRFASTEKQIEANTKALLSAIGELKAQGELATMSAIGDLRERIAVQGSKRN